MKCGAIGVSFVAGVPVRCTPDFFKHVSACFEAAILANSLATEGAVSLSKAKIDSQIKKGDDKGSDEQFPPTRPNSPEDAGIADLSHPKPFLYPAGDDSHESDKQDYCGDDGFQRPPSREVVIHDNRPLLD